MNKLLLAAGLLTLSSYCSSQNLQVLQQSETHELFSPTQKTTSSEKNIHDFFTNFMQQQHIYLPGFTPSEKLSAFLVETDTTDKKSYYETNEFFTSKGEPIYTICLEDSLLVNYKSEVVIKFLETGEDAKAYSFYYTISNAKSGHGLSGKIRLEDHVLEGGDPIEIPIFKEQMQLLYDRVREYFVKPLLTEKQ